MTTAPFKEGTNEIISLVGNYDAIAIVGIEGLPWHCSRRMIADYISLIEGLCVFNIIDNKSLCNCDWE